jgi:diacylglycerol O-acyltransferase / wax synthase
MDALEPLDELFLALDGGVTVGHSGGLLLFDAASASEPLTAERLRQLIDGQLDAIPVLRRRPVPDPSRPGRHRWTEDEAINLADHVHGHRLADGDDRAIGRHAAQLNARPLHRSRPLWEMHVIDGLLGGRVAICLKFHHALGDAVPSRQVVETLFAVGGEADAAFDVGGEGLPKSRAPDATAAPASTPPTAAATRFNRPLSGQRDFAFAPFGRARVERIRSVSALTFTDVLVAAWAGALRGWLALRGETPVVPLVARLPMSLRRPDDAPGGGNRLAVVPVAVPADQGDPRARLQHAHEAMTWAKQIGSSEAGVADSAGVNFALSTFVSSSRPIAWDGAAGIGSYPITMVNVSGLSIACVTTATVLWVGVHVDAEQVADPWSLVRAFDLALTDLQTVTAP